MARSAAAHGPDACSAKLINGENPLNLDIMRALTSAALGTSERFVSGCAWGEYHTEDVAKAYPLHVTTVVNNAGTYFVTDA